MTPASEMSEPEGEVRQGFVEGGGELEVEDGLEMERGAQGVHSRYFRGGIVGEER